MYIAVYIYIFKVVILQLRHERQVEFNHLKSVCFEYYVILHVILLKDFCKAEHNLQSPW